MFDLSVLSHAGTDPEGVPRTTSRTPPHFIFSDVRRHWSSLKHHEEFCNFTMKTMLFVFVFGLLICSGSRVVCHTAFLFGRTSGIVRGLKFSGELHTVGCHRDLWAHTLTHTHTHTYTHAHTPTDLLTHTHKQTLSHTLTHTHSHTLTYIHTHSHTHTHAHSHTHTHQDNS